METMKKQWGKPLTGVQEFVPQEFIAGCYHVRCITDSSNRVYEYVYFDTNNNGILDTGDQLIYRNLNGFRGCNVMHTGVQSESELALNAFVSNHSSSNQNASDCRTTRVYYWNQHTTNYGDVHVCYDPTSAEYIADRPNAS